VYDPHGTEKVGAIRSFTARLFSHDKTVSIPPVTRLLWVRIYSGKLLCGVKQVLEKINPDSAEAEDWNVDYIPSGYISRVTFLPQRQAHLEPYHDFPQLGRITVLDMEGRDAAFGIIESVERNL
jgi:translation elongation factor EF-1alpha